MHANILPSVTRSDEQEPVRKARETTTRRTRSWRRRIVLSAVGLAMTLLLRRLRGSKQSRREPVGSSDRTGGGRSLGRRLAMLAASAVAMAVARRFVRRMSGRSR